MPLMLGNNVMGLDGWLNVWRKASKNLENNSSIRLQILQEVHYSKRELFQQVKKFISDK